MPERAAWARPPPASIRSTGVGPNRQAPDGFCHSLPRPGLFLAQASARQAPGVSAHLEGQPPPLPSLTHSLLSSRLCSEAQSQLVTRGA